MSPRRMREWPRLIAALVALGVVLLGVGLLVGATALAQGGSTTTTTTTTATPTTMTTTVVRQASSTGPTKALSTERSTVKTLRHELSDARTRLRRAAHHPAPTHKIKSQKTR
jgi:hypothetical protein